MALPAATVNHMHFCPKTTGTVPHVGGPIVTGSPNVLIGNLPAARIGDTQVCVGPPDKITRGSTGVFINGRGAARLGDATAHGGKITVGNPSVLIGDTITAPTKAPSMQAQRNLSKALGEIGMVHAKQRLSLITDNRYIDRYHGPDDIAHDPCGNLVEIEAKGNNKNSTSVTKDKKGNKQSSQKKNKRRANLMKNKTQKIDVPSNRQGGPYTQDEINLWKEIKRNKGDKRHLSIHTNTETGLVRVLERDRKGNIIKELDKFTLNNFDEIKQSAKEALTSEPT